MTWQFKNIIAALAMGIVAAALGALIVLGFFMPSGFFDGGGAIDQNQDFLKTSLGIKAYGKLEVFEFFDKALPSAAGIYKRKTSLSDKFYFEKDRLGSGFVLTADGWIVTNKNVVAGALRQNIAVSVKGKIYAGAESVILDPWTEAAFIKIKADNLPVASLGASDSLALGDTVFSGLSRNNFWSAQINSIGEYPPRTSQADAILSSEEFGKVIKLSGVVPAPLNGAMLVNRFGEVVGIAVKKGEYVLPANYFKKVISGLLRGQGAARPYFGVNYLDLSFVLSENSPADRGAYVFGGGIVPSVVPGSPAAKAGIATGDIIVRVENDELNNKNNLAELLSDYAPEEKINIKILREGKEIDISIILGKK